MAAVLPDSKIAHRRHTTKPGVSQHSGREDVQERVRVTVRARPVRQEEEGDSNEPSMDVLPEERKVVLHRSNGLLETMDFLFDAVLPPSSSQEDVYNVVAKPVVQDVMKGFNGTIMAYGQTGAGKTYTLSSLSSTNYGIIPRAAADVFAMSKADSLHVYRVSMSYIQIYLEMVQDLLEPSSTNLPIREGDNGVYIAGVEQVEVSCVEDCLKLLLLGEKNRTVAFTKMNANSSRSHAVVTLTVEKKKKEALADATNSAELDTLRAEDCVSLPKDANASKDRVIVGRLFMVDLAGSERMKKSGLQGLRASEAKSVNLSLTALGKCINARADPSATHVPFRDSKLTRLLQESLGGNAKTSLVINVAPCTSHLSESLSSLLFGSRAMMVKTRAEVNEAEEFRTLTRTLQDAVDQHDERVHSLQEVVYSQEEQLIQARAHLEEQQAAVLSLQSEKEMQLEKHMAEVDELTREWTIKYFSLEVDVQQKMCDLQAAHEEALALETSVLRDERNSLAAELASAHARLTDTEAKMQQLIAQIQALQDDQSRVEEHNHRRPRFLWGCFSS